MLTHQIESGLWQRAGQALSNFAQTLPTPQSDLAQQILKDPYVFDFLSLTRSETLRKQLPSIEALEAELKEVGYGE